MLNRALARFRDFFSYEFPHLGVAIVALLVAAVWRGSGTSAIGAVVLVIIHSKQWMIERIFEVVARPTPPAMDDAKLRAVVESLNKVHANQKALDEKIGHATEAIGKINLRFALKPLEDAGIGGSF